MRSAVSSASWAVPAISVAKPSRSRASLSGFVIDSSSSTMRTVRLPACIASRVGTKRAPDSCVRRPLCGPCPSRVSRRRRHHGRSCRRRRGRTSRRRSRRRRCRGRSSRRRSRRRRCGRSRCGRRRSRRRRCGRSRCCRRRSLAATGAGVAAAAVVVDATAADAGAARVVRMLGLVAGAGDVDAVRGGLRLCRGRLLRDVHARAARVVCVLGLVARAGDVAGAVVVDAVVVAATIITPAPAVVVAAAVLGRLGCGGPVLGGGAGRRGAGRGGRVLSDLGHNDGGQDAEQGDCKCECECSAHVLEHALRPVSGWPAPGQGRVRAW